MLLRSAGAILRLLRRGYASHPNGCNMTNTNLRSDPDAFVCLRPEFLARFGDDPREWPAYKQLKSFFRKTQRGSVEHEYPRLKKGQPARYRFAEALVEYVRQKYGWDVTIQDAVEPAAAQHRDDGVWMNYGKVVDVLTGPFKDVDEMYVHNKDKEIPVIARSCITYIGRENAAAGDPLDDEACLARGQRIMRRTVDEYARWLYMVRSKEYRSVMYCVVPAGEAKSLTYRRVAVTVMIAVTESAFTRNCNGQLIDHETTAADILPYGKHVFLGMVADFGNVSDVTVQDYTKAQVHCLTYQAAYFTRKLRPFSPVIFMPDAKPRHRQRLLRLGYIDTGVCLKDTDKKIMMLSSAKDAKGPWSWPHLRAYLQMLMTFQAYEFANREDWRKEDRDRRKLQG